MGIGTAIRPNVLLAAPVIPESCFHISIWPVPTLYASSSAAKVSTATAPLRVGPMITDGVPASPLLPPLAAIGKLIFTPVNEIAPATAFFSSAKVTSTVLVPVAGSTRYHIEERTVAG